MNRIKFIKRMSNIHFMKYYFKCPQPQYIQFIPRNGRNDEYKFYYEPKVTITKETINEIRQIPEFFTFFCDEYKDKTGCEVNKHIQDLTYKLSYDIQTLTDSLTKKYDKLNDVVHQLCLHSDHSSSFGETIDISTKNLKFLLNDYERVFYDKFYKHKKYNLFNPISCSVLEIEPIYRYVIEELNIRPTLHYYDRNSKGELYFSCNKSQRIFKEIPKILNTFKHDDCDIYNSTEKYIDITNLNRLIGHIDNDNTKLPIVTNKYSSETNTLKKIPRELELNNITYWNLIELLGREYTYWKRIEIGNQLQ